MVVSHADFGVSSLIIERGTSEGLDAISTVDFVPESLHFGNMHHPFFSTPKLGQPNWVKRGAKCGRCLTSKRLLASLFGAPVADAGIPSGLFLLCTGHLDRSNKEDV